MISKNLKRKFSYSHEESDDPSREPQPKLKRPKILFIFFRNF